MGNQGLYKLYGGVYVRCKSTLCPACEHYRKPKEGTVANDGTCVAQEKFISNAIGLGGTCKLFAEHSKAVTVDIDSEVIPSIILKVKPFNKIELGCYHENDVKAEKVHIAYLVHQHFIGMGVVPTRKSFKAWLDCAIDTWQKTVKEDLYPPLGVYFELKDHDLDDLRWLQSKCQRDYRSKNTETSNAAHYLLNLVLDQINLSS